MYHKIMVPVDLAHVERLDKALTTAADLAKHYRTPICYVGVTTTLPGPVAHTPEEFARKLERFGRSQAERHGLDQPGLEITTLSLTSHDPAVDLDDVLMDAIKDSGADLIVMASHVPGLADHIFASNAGHLASHAKVSVLVVR